jgi:hypothetical protein
MQISLRSNCAGYFQSFAPNNIDTTVINRNRELLPHHIVVVIRQPTQHIVFEKVRPDLLRDHQYSTL